ncbi:hypothetical protein ACLKA7_000554 [Drosophila subpalustris]
MFVVATVMYSSESSASPLAMLSTEVDMEDMADMEEEALVVDTVALEVDMEEEAMVVDTVALEVDMVDMEEEEAMVDTVVLEVDIMVK